MIDMACDEPSNLVDCVLALVGTTVSLETIQSDFNIN